MKFALLLLFLVSLRWQTVGQNLVPNSGFENKTSCPNYISQVHFATPWQSPTQGSPDYLHECSTDMFAAVPSNQFGNQAARTGDAYAGFYVFYNALDIPPPIPGYREYIQSSLTQSLQPKHFYSVEFYVSLSDYSKYGADAIGAVFTTNPIIRNDDLPISNVNPQINNPIGNIIIDKTGWTKISGCFEADSNYQYITIGAFKDGAFIQFEPVSSPYLEHYSYYFIDDISVIEVPSFDLPDSIVACFGDAVMLDAKAGGSCLWSTGETTQEISANNSGWYNVVKTIEGCAINDSTLVTYHQGIQFSLGNDTSLSFCEGPVFTIGIEASNNSTYHWSNGSSDTYISVAAPGTYSLTVTDENNCITSDAITFTDGCPYYLYVPNAFSPNGDGRNERFLCIAEGITSFDMKIYNRWGQIIFRTNDYKNGWNGLHNNKKCESGVYVYTIEYTAGNEKRWKDGNVALLR